MMKTNTNKLGHARGFTLIELLVVIAIIGILASVVLASLNTARDKGKDAAAKAAFGQARAGAELAYDTNGGNYTTLCPTDVAIPVQAGASAAAILASLNSAAKSIFLLTKDLITYLLSSEMFFPR